MHYVITKSTNATIYAWEVKALPDVGNESTTDSVNGPLIPDNFTSYYVFILCVLLLGLLSLALLVFGLLQRLIYPPQLEEEFGFDIDYVSTGDSLDDEDGEKVTGETKRNTSYNEVIDADNPQTPEENHLTRGYNRAARNKSPSDLEADLEDNQDYDSTVSQSETNLTTIGQSSPQSVLSNRLPGNLRSRTSPDTPRPLSSSSSREERDSSRPVSYPSRIRDGAPRDLESSGLESRSLYLSSRFRDQSDTCRSPSYQYHRSDRVASSNTSNSNSADLIRLQARNTELERLLTTEREEKRRLQTQIEQERDEKSRLRQMLDSRDLQIEELRNELGLLSTDFDLCCEDIEKLQQENAALVRAFSQLKTT